MSETNITGITDLAANEGKRFVSPAEQAKEAIQTLICPLNFKSLTEFTVLGKKFKHAGSYRGRTDLNYSPEYGKPKLDKDFEKFEGVQIEPENLKSGDLVLVEYVMPGSGQHCPRNITSIFAGVIDQYSPKEELIEHFPGVIKFKRGMRITDATIPHGLRDMSYGTRNDQKIPLGVITKFVNVGLDKKFEGFDERALYDILVESVGKFNKETPALLEIDASEGLLSQKKAVESAEQLKWIKTELTDGGKATYERTEADLRRQKQEIEDRLANLSQERQQYIADLEYTKSIIESLKDKSKKAPPRTEETLKTNADLKKLFTDYGFDLSKVNPLFFPYYRSLILTIGEIENRSPEYLESLKGSLNVEPKNIVDVFPEIDYELDRITVPQAIFTYNLENFLGRVPKESKGEAAKKLERLYFKYFHPDSNFSPFEKNLAQELCKKGSSQYHALRNKYPSN